MSGGDGDFLEGFDIRTAVAGWILLGSGWVFNGLSLMLVVVALTGVGPGFELFGIALASVSLATVAGFISLLPGGIGVRELVIIPLLGGTVGVGIAVVAAVVIRLIWMAAEFSGAAIIYLVHRAIAVRSPVQ